MADHEDYQAFADLLRHPEEWSLQTRAQVERLLVQQREMVERAHPKDRKGRARLQRVVVEIEAAVTAYENLNPIEPLSDYAASPPRCAACYSSSLPSSCSSSTLFSASDSVLTLSGDLEEFTTLHDETLM